MQHAALRFVASSRRHYKMSTEIVCSSREEHVNACQTVIHVNESGRERCHSETDSVGLPEVWEHALPRELANGVLRARVGHRDVRTAARGVAGAREGGSVRL